VDVRPHGENITVVASGGIGVFDHQSEIIGLNPDQSFRSYVDRAWGSDRVVLVQRATRNDEKFMQIPVRMYDQHSARLTDSIELTLPNAIQRQPTILQSADGVVVVGFGEVSVLLGTE
jgi:hypothetical protein